MADRPTRSGAEPSGNGEIEITPEMIEAGEGVFYEAMLAGDYLSTAPPASVIRAMLSAIFFSMGAKRRS
jgi:hypothetical protein